MFVDSSYFPDKLSEKDGKAIAQIVELYGKLVREDILGAIIYTGGFLDVKPPDDGVVKLAEKIEALLKNDCT